MVLEELSSGQALPMRLHLSPRTPFTTYTLTGAQTDSMLEGTRTKRKMAILP